MIQWNYKARTTSSFHAYIYISIYIYPSGSAGTKVKSSMMSHVSPKSRGPQNKLCSLRNPTSPIRYFRAEKYHSVSSHLTRDHYTFLCKQKRKVQLGKNGDIACLKKITKHFHQKNIGKSRCIPGSTNKKINQCLAPKSAKLYFCIDTVTQKKTGFDTTKTPCPPPVLWNLPRPDPTPIPTLLPLASGEGEGGDYTLPPKKHQKIKGGIPFRKTLCCLVLKFQGAKNNM